MTLNELKGLRVGNIVRMGKYHWVMEGKNSLGEPVFHRVDDQSVKMLDAIFIPHLLTMAEEGYEYKPPVVEEKKAAESDDDDDTVEVVGEIEIQQPKKKRGRPRKAK